MESFPLFFRIRAITFIIIMLFSFLWLVLLSVEIFARWTISDQISQSLMIVFILANTATLILLPILLLVEFRAWLDAARLFSLSILQVGSAAAGTCWTPKIQCPDQNLDDIGVCQLINVYTLIASWIIPVMLLLYSSYFSAVVYLQSRIPVVVEPKRCSSVDRETGSSDYISTWKEMLKGIVGIQGSGTDTNIQPQPLMLPTVHTGETSPSRPSPQGQSTLSSLPHTSSQQPLHTSHSVPSRHYSLPAFKHGKVAHIRPSLTLPIPPAYASNPSSSHPQTPSSHSYSIPSSANHSFTFRPGDANVQFPPIDHRWRSKHLSMMPSSSSSPREMQSAEGSPTTRSMRAKLIKPLPVHLL